MTTLSDLYDADRRVKDAVVRRLTLLVNAPHPLHDVQYADGIDRCTHAKRCAGV